MVTLRGRRAVNPVVVVTSGCVTEKGQRRRRRAGESTYVCCFVVAVGGQHRIFICEKILRENPRMDYLWNNKAVCIGIVTPPLPMSMGYVAELVELKDTFRICTPLPSPLLQPPVEDYIAVQLFEDHPSQRQVTPTQIFPIAIGPPPYLSPYTASTLLSPSDVLMMEALQSPAPSSPQSITLSPSTSASSPSSSYTRTSDTSYTRTSDTSYTLTSPLSSSAISQSISLSLSPLSSSEYEYEFEEEEYSSSSSCETVIWPELEESGFSRSLPIPELESLDEPAEKVLKDVMTWAKSPYEQVQLTIEASTSQKIRYEALERIVSQL
ncbi:uncharacterized protein LOC6504709 isoform X3 [Drosophila ananassae]|nr:uncharacterized protein LOC6504709 isoform X3 [Drosophila ananassae]